MRPMGLSRSVDMIHGTFGRVTSGRRCSGGAVMLPGALGKVLTYRTHTCTVKWRDILDIPEKCDTSIHQVA